MKQHIRVPLALFALVTFVLFSRAVMAGDYWVAPDRSTVSAETKLSDLTLSNFFSDGWSDPWSKRPHDDGAPDMTLLRVQTNLLLRSLRTDFYDARLVHGSSTRDIEYLSQLVEYAFNRRLMLAVFGNYEWVNSRSGDDLGGPAWGALARFQLVDTPHASYALNLRVAAPNGGLFEKQTTLSAALAGWHDLTPLGLDRVGLYWHVQEESLAGPHPPGSQQNDLTYDLTLAKTWTSRTAAIGNFSTFVEAYARTGLDGPDPGNTTITVTPGLRCTLARHHVVMVGVDIPVTQPRPFDEVYRVTYIYSF